MSEEQTTKATVIGLVVAGIGVALIFWPPSPFGVSALYIGAALLGTGLFFTDRKTMTKWMAQLRDLGAFWKR